jgi:hypothetical protein
MEENASNGGFEGNHIIRMCTKEGLIHMNTMIGGYDLPNFPFKSASRDFVNHTPYLKNKDWTYKYCANDPEWGITDTMEVYEFNE